MLKTQAISKSWKFGEGHEQRIDGKLSWLAGAANWAEKKGGHDRGTSPYSLQMQVPPLMFICLFYVMANIQHCVSHKKLAPM